jgi:hypothetical protein
MKHIQAYSNLTQSNLPLYEATEQEIRTKIWEDFGEFLGPRVLRTIFMKSEEVEIVSYNVDMGIQKYLDDFDESDSRLVTWGLSLYVIDRSKVANRYIRYFNADQPLMCGLTIETYLDVDIEDEPQTYDSPGYYNVSLSRVDHQSVLFELDGVYIEGRPRLDRVTGQVRDMLNDKQLDDLRLDKLIRSNLGM